MSAVRKPSLSDPLSLDGLEPLMDQIFAVQNEFAPDQSTFQRTKNLQPVNAHVDFYAAETTGADSTRNQILTKQLIELKEELKAFQFTFRHLQLELATREDQLHYMPELFSKVLELAALETENNELKIENAALLTTIEHLKPKTHQPTMGRRILNRFFGT